MTLVLCCAEDMKFGKLLQSRAEELKSTGLTEHFLRYKALKKTLKQISKEPQQGEQPASEQLADEQPAGELPAGKCHDTIPFALHPSTDCNIQLWIQSCVSDEDSGETGEDSSDGCRAEDTEIGHAFQSLEHASDRLEPQSNSSQPQVQCLHPCANCVLDLGCLFQLFHESRDIGRSQARPWGLACCLQIC